jgi:bacterioferritin (cytochrome b1)
MTLPEFMRLMLDDLRNECTHLQFYLYHAAAINGLHRAEYQEFFDEAARSEMAHVRQFLDRILGLNNGLRIPCQISLDAHNFPQFTDPQNILRHACVLETQVIENYALRLQQLETLAIANPVEAAYLTVFYEDQLKDSYEDRDHMRHMLV